MDKNQKLSARERMLEFSAAPDGALFEFSIPGDVADAEKFIGRMRVALSKERAEKSMNREKYEQFKMIRESVEFDYKSKTTRIRLRKKNQPPSEFDHLFEELEF